MKQKLAQWFFLACAAVFVLTAAVATILREKPDYSFFENRMMAHRPGLTVAGVWDGSYFTDFETFLTDQAAGRTTLLKANTLLDLSVFHRPKVNDNVVTDEALLSFLSYETVDRAQLEEKAAVVADHLSQVQALVESYGGRFYYVTVPCQYVFYEDAYPWYLNNRDVYTPLSMEVLADALEAAGVPLLDMGPIMAAQPSLDGLTSRIDNHFGMYGAYLTYREIMQAVTRDTGYDLPVLDETNSHMQTLPNHYLGSRERKMYGLWSANEQLTMQVPNQPVAFTRTDNHEPMDPWVYRMPKTASDWVLYDFYMGGDIANTVLDTNRPDLPNALIYGDSFTNAVECVLYTGFNQTHSLDLRHYQDGTLGQYIREYQPEVVVCVRDYQAIFVADANGSAPD